MSRWATRRAGRPTFDEIERMLREHFASSVPDVGGIDLRNMAERARQSQDVPSGPLPQWNRVPKRWPLRVGYALGAIVLAVALARATFYFAPGWERMAYASIGFLPASRYLVTPTDVAMLELAKRGQVQPIDIAASDRGVSVHVLGAYADSIRTVLFLRVDGPETGAEEGGSWLPNWPDATLTDQFGHHYTQRFGRWKIGAREGYAEFDGIAPWKLELGLRLRLQLQSVQWVPESATGAGFRDVSGSWTAEWVQTSVGQERTFQVNSVATSDGVTIRLTDVILTPSAAQFTLSGPADVDQPTAAAARAEGTRSTSSADESYVERADDGARFPMLSFGTISYGPAVSERIVSLPLTRPGRYVLVLTSFDGRKGHWEFPFTIP